MNITRNEKANATKDKIIQAAIAEFYRHGVGATTLNHIAQTANVTRGAIYWHFKNKKAIFDEINRLMIEKMGEIEIRTIQQTADVSPLTLIEILRQYTMLSQDGHFMRLAKIIFIESITSPDIMAKQRDIFTIITNEWIRGLIEICVNKGHFSVDLSTDSLVKIYSLLINGIILQSVIYFSDEDIEKELLFTNNELINSCIDDMSWL